MRVLATKYAIVFLKARKFITFEAFLHDLIESVPRFALVHAFLAHHCLVVVVASAFERLVVERLVVRAVLVRGDARAVN